MDTNLIRQRINSTVEPFVFRLSDGTRVPVAHPDFVAVSPDLVIVIAKDQSVIKIDPYHIVAIDEKAAKRSGANGKNPK